MGIAFDVDGEGYTFKNRASWSYSGFHEFRKKLAAAVGIQLDEMEGFGGSNPWAAYGDEPLIPLLSHSDCDGELSPEDCAKVAARLDNVIERLPDEALYGYDRVMGRKLIDMMRRAAEVKKPLWFC